MTIKNLSLRMLLLVVVSSPLQAQSVFACEMTGKVMYGECCCIWHKSDKDSIDTDCDDVVDSSSKQCCEHSVELKFDTDARSEMPILQLLEVRSDVDPPISIVASFDYILPVPSRADVRAFEHYSSFQYTHSDTYLITQRLRI